MNKIALIVLMLPLLAYGDEWTEKDTIRQSVFTIVDLMDWKQTQDIARHPNLHETNPLLGSHPTNAKINEMLFFTYGVQIGIAYILPENYRAVWQYSSIAWEAIIVGKNRQIGLKVGF
jgi:hypothetical protein